MWAKIGEFLVVLLNNIFQSFTTYDRYAHLSHVTHKLLTCNNNYVQNVYQAKNKQNKTDFSPRVYD